MVSVKMDGYQLVRPSLARKILARHDRGRVSIPSQLLANHRADAWLLPLPWLVAAAWIILCGGFAAYRLSQVM